MISHKTCSIHFNQLEIIQETHHICLEKTYIVISETWVIIIIMQDGPVVK